MLLGDSYGYSYEIGDESFSSCSFQKQLMPEPHLLDQSA